MRLLLISGSTRGASTNAAALRTAAVVAPMGVDALLFGGLDRLPAFNPDDDHDLLPSSVTELRRQVADADALVFSTPEYAGGLPGSFKNLLDWTVGGVEMNSKPCAWINVATEGRGNGAYAALATVLGYVGADVLGWACVRLPVAHQLVDGDGLIIDEHVRAQLADLVKVIAHEVRARPGARP